MKRLSMRKLKEVLRLRYELGLGQRQIARSCSIGHGTVYEYLTDLPPSVSQEKQDK
jgi:DNA-binding transcriptional regulator LsrR (DeoR family)